MYKPTTKTWQPTVPSIFKITAVSSAILALGFMTGCSSAQSTKNSSSSKQLGYLDAGSLDSLEDLLSATDMRAVEGDRLLVLKHGDVWKRMSVGYKMNTDQWNPRIDAQRGWFTSRQPYIDRLSARASRYLYHTVKEAERRGLPTELALLPIIESSYDPAATSSAAAAGLWQFIPSTGRIYGLKQTSLYDGRRDVVESTRAAYEFLGSLYNQFGSWELALAAYNAGPGRIQQAINRNKAAGLPTDYWSLKLPQETMYYVPRFMAVAQIVKNPSTYGVSLPPIANRPHFREVNVGAVGLNEVASITGLSRAELYALNPGHRGERIDSESPMRILIPADLSPTVDEKLKKLKSSSSSWSASATPTTSTSTTITPSKTTPPPIQASTTNTSKTSTVTTPVATTSPTSSTKLAKTPQGSSALAAFANNADIPSAPRIPVAVEHASNVKPVSVEPPITAAEREKILAAVKAEGATKTVDEVLKPVASKDEQDLVVAELKQIAPQGTEIVDPYDGKIKLTAIQTSLSVSEQQGKELTKGFSYPKGVADNTKPDSDEAKLNQGKNFVKTDSEVVVVAPKGKRSTYKVVAGDTLALIASKNGVNWRDVAKWNQIDPNAKLYVGTSIYLYDAKPQEASKPKTQPETYIVQPNDTLTQVASEFGLSVKQLADYNDLSITSNLLVGQKLSLKDNSSTKKDTSTSNKSAKVATKSYVVKRGEYLKLIADRYALSNQELADLTPGLTASSNLLAGQKINVPTSEVSSAKNDDKSSASKTTSKTEPSYKVENYKVERGDTLYSIANQSKISVSELASLNNLSTNGNLLVGQTIKVPAGSSVPDTYTVQSGDSLSAISSKYNLGMDYIANINGISRNTNLRVGQKLKLTGEEPKVVTAKAEAKENKKPDFHVVKSGETLSSIARKYDLQTSQLADFNDLTSNAGVKVGQKLKLESTGNSVKSKSTNEPVKQTAVSAKNTEKYTVKAGESLNSIAKKAGVSTSELASLNNLNTNSGLRVGQSIAIPKKISQYTVKRGDTLIGLASRYGMDAKSLADLNGIQPSTQLRIGEVIKVPNL
jgi:LysM repeat protein/soluble lytic murein transglycosylase-like protein